MIDSKTAAALARAEKHYPTKEFNSDLRVQLTCFELSMATAEATIVRPRLMVRHFDEKDEKKWTHFSLEGVPKQHELRQMTFHAIGIEVARNTCGVLAVFIVAEAFAAVREKEPDGPISELPDRKEVVMLAGTTPDQRANSVVIPIVDREKNGLLKFGEADVSEFDPNAEKQSQLPMLMPFWAGYAQGLVDKHAEKKKTKKGKK